MQQKIIPIFIIQLDFNNKFEVENLTLKFGL